MLTNTHRVAFEQNLIDKVPALLDISMQWIKENIKPADLYSPDQLSNCAEDNGYIHKEN
jgi:hypothetical protein